MAGNEIGSDLYGEHALKSSGPVGCPRNMRSTFG